MTTDRLHCEAPLWVEGQERPCQRTIGTRSWYDASGRLHTACWSHVAERLHRYPESDPPEPTWLHEHPEYADPITAYKSWTDAGWTEPELREAFRG